MSGRKAGCNLSSLAPIKPMMCSFQSPSGQKAGCNRQVGVDRLGAVAQFQSSSGLLAGCNSGRWSALRRARGCFNPHPAFWPDATCSSPSTTAGMTRFQSSSGQKAGCNPPASGPRNHPSGFNPHPAFWPDATGTRAGCPAARRCFNPHPAFWPDATSTGQRPNLPQLRVSILIRPEGRMQPVEDRPTGAILHRFNPHPARRPDATHASSAPWRPSCARFNPHPARRLDATGARCAEQRPVHVQFQSSSGQKAGCNWRVLRDDGTFWLFQSSSGQKAGCNRAPGSRCRLPSRCFNPHPARRPDATTAPAPQGPPPGQVSILIRPEGRMQPSPVSVLYRR